MAPLMTDTQLYRNPSMHVMHPFNTLPRPTFVTSNPTFIGAPAAPRMLLQRRCSVSTATLVTSLENLTNMKQQLATTNKNVIDGFNEHAKTSAGITDGLSSQTAALAALEAWLRTHSDLLDQLSRTSEAQNTRLDNVVARVDSTTDTLRNDVAEVRTRLITDLRCEVHALDATLHTALARLPVHAPAPHSPTDQDVSQGAPTADTTAAPDSTSTTLDDRLTATAGTWSQDVTHGAPATGHTATDSTSGGAPTTSAAPHNV